MTFPAGEKIRFDFITQLPRDDGCGLVVAQMLTGRSYADIAALVDWGDQTSHYMSWTTAGNLLGRLGMKAGESRSVTRWSDVHGLAFVHVQPDHYALYDADHGVFYDPGMATGPDTETSLMPMAYYPVHSPLIAVEG